MDKPALFQNNLDTVSIILMAMLMEHGGPVKIGADSLKAAFVLFGHRGLCVDASRDGDEDMVLRLNI